MALAVASCQSPYTCVHRGDTATVSQPRRSPQQPRLFTEVSYQPVGADVPVVQGAEFVKDDEICMQCHETFVKSFRHGNVHRNNGCESCHGPGSKHVEARGKEPGLIFSFKIQDPVVKAEVCLRCHEQSACAEGGRWRTSKHAHCGVSCVDCHNAHYDIPPGVPPVTQKQTADASASEGHVSLTGLESAAVDNSHLPSLRGTSKHLGAVAPYVCYRCHGDKQELQAVAHPHQILGPNGFNCTTCHDPHGQIREETRTQLCLQCHKGAPTMAWHSAIHFEAGVACTDCHSPHPKACVPQFVDIQHTDVSRPKRLPMSVDQPGVCFKCHPKIFAQFQLPSHHPVTEGKMVCSDCHDPHGQKGDNLKEATLNLVCYKCHADKQGPFAFEHPPVRENCGICHNPHGAVANNLLKQSLPFLCLRCHPGHNSNNHPGVTFNINQANGGSGTTVGALKQAFYTDCTQCHQQIHGTNRISQRGYGGWFSR